jgi:hypothetical protein
VTTLTLERTAHHEAAHAVIATLHGIPVRYTTIRPRRRDYGGVTVVRHRADETWQAYGALLCAGPIADDIYGTRRPDLARGVGDLAHLRTMARQVRQETRAGRPPAGVTVTRTASVQAIARIAWAQAHRDLVANYGAVLAVAERLLACRRTLAGPELRDIVASAPPAEMPRAIWAADFWPPWFMPGWWTTARKTPPRTNVKGSS